MPISSAIAMPDTDKYRYQVGLVPDRVRSQLGLWWLFVGESGNVEAVPPP